MSGDIWTMEPLDMAQRGLSTLAFLQLWGVNGPQSQALLTLNTTLPVPEPLNSLPQRPNWSQLQNLHWPLPGLSAKEQMGLEVVQGDWKLVKNDEDRFYLNYCNRGERFQCRAELNFHPYSLSKLCPN